MATIEERVRAGDAFYCQTCCAIEDYDPPEGFYLLAWAQASERFQEQHRECRARPSTDARAGGEAGA